MGNPTGVIRLVLFQFNPETLQYTYETSSWFRASKAGIAALESIGVYFCKTKHWEDSFIQKADSPMEAMDLADYFRKESVFASDSNAKEEHTDEELSEATEQAVSSLEEAFAGFITR